MDALTATAQSVVSPVAGVAGSIADFGGDFSGGLFGARSLVRENRRLQDRVASMSLYDEQSKRLEREITSLRTMLGMSVGGEKQRVAADIVGFVPRDRRITLSVGSADGIQPNMPVVAAQGLVGIVQSVSAHRTQAVLLTSQSRDRKIGAIVANRNPAPMGLLMGANASSLMLEFQDTTAPVEIGDTVLTAGASEYIPRGIPVGKVVQVEDDEAFGVRRAMVDPFVSIGELREVVVLK